MSKVLSFTKNFLRSHVTQKEEKKGKWYASATRDGGSLSAVCDSFTANLGNLQEIPNLLPDFSVFLKSSCERGKSSGANSNLKVWSRSRKIVLGKSEGSFAKIVSILSQSSSPPWPIFKGTKKKKKYQEMSCLVWPSRNWFRKYFANELN